MSLGGRFCEDVAESRMAFADSDVATSTGDVRTSPFRKAAPGLLGIPGMPSNHNVHDLLECPVCMNLMCPPIHQVCFSICSKFNGHGGSHSPFY